MSRIEKVNGEYDIAYGLDHICGWFVQIFERGIDDPIVDMDQEKNPDLTPERIIAIGEEYGFIIE